MEIESGNIGDLDTRGTGWTVGFGEWTRDGVFDLRYMPEAVRSSGICLKWMDHRAGDPRGSAKPPSVGRSLSILVGEAGRFRLEFSDDPGFPEGRTVAHVLARRGDFVAWGEGLHHRWFVDDDCIVLTLRWSPDEPTTPGA